MSLTREPDSPDMYTAKRMHANTRARIHIEIKVRVRACVFVRVRACLCALAYV